MELYRIASKKHRTGDLSGRGAYNEGGRWNSPGVYALYTSQNRSLAALEILVHVEETELPPNMFIMTINVDDNAPIYEVQDAELPAGWRIAENLALKSLGDKIFRKNAHIGIKARSAVMPEEYNYILNPQYPGYNDLARVVNIAEYIIDVRLLGR
jgi:RES domain-containing protein